MSEYEYFDLEEFNRNEKWGQAKEEEAVDQAGKTDLKPITYAERYQLPEMTEEEINARAAYYDSEWQRRREEWRKPPTVSWRVAFAATVTVIVAIAFVWAVVRL